MSSKWEREIEDLLRKKRFGEEGPRPPRPPEPPRRRGGGLSQWLRRQSPERLMLYGLGLALAVYLLRPFLGGLTIVLVVASLAFIVGAILSSFMRREAPYTDKRWRGQIIELPPRPGTPSYTWRRLRYNLRRWLNGRR